MGAQIVAIMPETQEYTRQLKADSGAPFRILTDLDNGYALSLNLAIWLGAEIQELLSYQDMAKFHGNDGWMLPIRRFSWSAATVSSRRASSIPISASAWEIDDLLEALESASREKLRLRTFLTLSPVGEGGSPRSGETGDGSLSARESLRRERG
jgi:hypothetical protein